MTDDEVCLRIAQGEDTRTQFKSAPIEVGKLAAELAAFTNTCGGVILFGVADDGRVVGLDSKQKHQLDAEISDAANDHIRPSVYPQTEFHTIQGKLILAVIVPEGIYKPYSDKAGNIWVKAGPDKRRVTAREELQRMLQKSNLLNADEMPIHGTSWDDIEPSHVASFLERNYGIPKKIALERDASEARRVFGNLGLMCGTELTLVGLLLFGLDPQRFRPVDILKCVHFPGNDIADTKYLDSQDFAGNIRDLHKGAMAFLERNLRHEQAGQNFNSIGLPVVSIEALEEYVVNMLLHRDYFVRSPWRIFIFANRIELISPGALPENLTVEQMIAGVSIPRNARLFSFAIKDGIPYRGIGSGVTRALKLYVNVDFENDPNGLFFKTIVWLKERIQKKNVPVNPENIPVNPESVPVNPENVPVNPESVPVNPGNVPVNPENVPVNPESVPVNPESVPVNPESVPVNPESVPVNPESVPVNPENVPVNPESVPVNPESVPVNPESVPVNPENVPVNPASVPVNPESVPVNPESVPVNPENVPVNPESVPVNPESVPVNPENVPVNPENVPVNCKESKKEKDIRQRVKMAIRKKPGINRKALASLLGVSEKTVGRCVKSLAGYVEFRGASKTGGYYVTNSFSVEKTLKK